MSLRLFIGVKVNKQAAQIIGKMCNDIPLNIKWVPVQNYHITLKFLGNCQEESVQLIIKAINEAAQKVKPFSYSLSNLGAFPNVNRPRVFWVGVESGSTDLINLQREIDISMEKIGFNREKRKYHPHLTLARIKKPLSLEKYLDPVEKTEWERFENRVDTIILFQSILSPKGAIYNIKEKVNIF